MTMSGSETGLINTASIGGMQKPPGVNSPPAVHNIGMSFSTDGTPVYQPISGNSLSYEQPGCSGVAGTNGGGGDGSASGGVVSSQGINMNMGGSDPQKRKRGRPRKYGPDGAMTLGLAIPPAATLPPATACLSQSAGAFSPPAPQSAPALVAAPPPGTGTTGAPSSTPSGKKARGRPPGSTNRKQHQQHQRQQRQLDTQGQLGIGFTPHVITVQAGEDVSSRIMSFSQHGPRAICILSANGAISNVTLRQAATSGGTVTYEGRFEILSLSGSFMLSESGGQRSRTGGLSISLAGPDGRVLGGGVGGLLIAASPVQVVVASFITEGQKELKPYPIENPSMPGKLTPGSGATGANSPPSRGTLSESSGGPGSPLNQSSGACNNSAQQIMHGMPWK